MNTSGMFRLDWKDVAKGLATAVLSAVVLYLADLTKVPGFDLGALPWDTLIKVGLTAGIGYLAKNFFTDSQGKLGGVL